MPPVSGPYCNNCPNQSIGEHIVYPDGTGNNGIMVISDSPWKDEIRLLKNYAGASGAFFERQLARIKCNRGDFTIANTIWCRPPHLGWTDHPEKYPEVDNVINHCRPYLDNLIRDKKPKVFVALGNVALRRLCRVPAGTSMEERHSYVHETEYAIPCVASFHPSAIMQGKQKLTTSLIFTLRRAQEIANGTYRETKLELISDDNTHINDLAGRINKYLDDHLAANNNIIDILMLDIETPESGKLDEEDQEGEGVSYNIDRAGFSLSNNTGCSFPWAEPFIGILQRAILHSKMVAEWATNHFDTKRLGATGISINGKIVSGLWAWHFLQSDLLKGLAFVSPFFYAGPPFKHLGHINPAYYNSMDNAVGRLCTVGSMDGLKREGRLDRFMRHCVDADAIYVKMGSAGVNIDEVNRSQFMGRLKDEAETKLAEIQPQIPIQLKPVKLWKKAPSDMTGVELISGVVKPTDPNEWKQAMAIVEAAKDTVTAAQYKSARAKVNELRNPYIYKKVYNFNPNSSDQIIDLAKHLGIKPPKNYDGNDSMDAQELLKQSKRYPIFKDILYYKQRSHMMSNYNWPLDDKGKVYTTYGYHPSTWRKSSRNVNLMNLPKRNDLANSFRKILVAPDGYYWVTSDASAIEAVLVGYDAGSPAYIRLAKCGLHGWMTSAYHNNILSLDMPDDELTKACKLAKKKWPKDYETLKRVGHLSNYGGTPARIYEEYPEEFANEKEASILQSFYFSTAPGREVRKWQIAVTLEAHEKRYLLNHFNYKHYFYGVFKYDVRKKMDVWDDDAKRAIAFRPQADASAIQTEVVLRLAEGYDGMLDMLRLIIHDETALLVPENKVEDAATILHTEMTRPILELNGLSIGAETKYGKNLAPYDIETNVDGMREMVVEYADNAS